MTYMTRETTGNLVFDMLSVSDCTLEECCEEQHLTANQFRYGLTYVKDVLAEANAAPVVYDPRTHRYSLALQAGESTEYEILRLRIAAKQLQRLRSGTAAPAAAKFKAGKGSVTVRRFLHHLEEAEEDLELLLAELV
jgi:hypothetical protein